MIDDKLTREMSIRMSAPTSKNFMLENIRKSKNSPLKCDKTKNSKSSSPDEKLFGKKGHDISISFIEKKWFKNNIIITL